MEARIIGTLQHHYKARVLKVNVESEIYQKVTAMVSLGHELEFRMPRNDSLWEGADIELVFDGAGAVVHWDYR